METYTDAFGNVIPKGWGATTVSFVNRVTYIGRTRSGTQTHRGYKGLVQHTSLGPKGERCPHFHQKIKSARQCAAKAARKMAREAEKQEQEVAAYYCPTCQHPWGYHDAERGCTMPLSQHGLPVSSLEVTVRTCACREVQA